MLLAVAFGTPMPAPLRAAEPRPPRGWGASVLVLVTIVAITAGGWIVAASIPGEPTLAGGGGAAPGSVEVGPLSVPVAEGWTVVQSDPTGAGAVLSNGTGLLEIYPAGSPYTDPTTLLRDYVAQVLRPAGSQLSVGPVAPADGPAGTTAARASYQGTFPIAAHPLEGAVTAVVGADGAAAIFDGSAPQGQLLSVLDEIEGMIAGSVMV